VLRVNQNWRDNVAKGNEPIPYILINTDLGIRGYAARDMSFLSLSPGYLADGTYDADGTITAGGDSFDILSYDAKVLSFGTVSRNMKPRVNDLFAAFQNKEMATMDIVLNNADRYFTRLLPKEPFLGKQIRLYLAMPDSQFADHLKIFSGKINQYNDRQGQFTITAQEDYLSLDRTFYLKRSDGFTNYLTANETLPIVYGDLTDGYYGIWEAPCIDTVNHVYCFACHPVLSVANGNTVSVYVDDVLQTSGYTFSESNAVYSDYATVTFTADQGNSTVSVKGMGLDDSGTLIENIVDIVDDFLSTHVGWTGDLDATAKAYSSQVFINAGYKAAGCIAQDDSVWTIIQNMVSSFLADLFINGAGDLVLKIQNFSIQTGFEDLLRRQDIVVSDMYQDWTNLINQVWCQYRWNYNDSDFYWYSDGDATKNQLSQNVYGMRVPTDPYPFYFIRDTDTVTDIQSVLVDKFKDPIWVVNVTNNTGAMFQVETGDIILGTLENIYDTTGKQLVNQFWKVIQVQHDFDGFFTTLQLIDTGSFLYWAEYATGSYATPSPLGSGDLLANGVIMAGGDRDSTVY